MKINYEVGFWALLICIANVLVFMFLFIPTKNKAIQYIQSQNKTLKKSNDSLELVIQKNTKEISSKDSLIVVLNNNKVKIKYVYNEKIKRIEYLSDTELCKLFDSIFSKNNVSQ